MFEIYFDLKDAVATIVHAQKLVLLKAKRLGSVLVRTLPILRGTDTLHPCKETAYQQSS